jgi:predicted metal-binding membrane protein
MSGEAALLARREPATATAIGVAVVAGWAFLFWAVVDMSNPLAQLMMPMSAHWSSANVVAVFAMWTLMMVAMMLPSATPMLLTVATLNRRKVDTSPTWAFAGGYLALWVAFSAAATAVQWCLQDADMISPMMVSTSQVMSALLLLAAGVFQFTPLKRRCLRHCRTPMGFLITDWRDGLSGAWTMGLRHGVYCLGCCWALMCLLFVIGVMNLAWVGALTLAVLAEKTLPGGERIGNLLGIALIAGGVFSLATIR